MAYFRCTDLGANAPFDFVPFVCTGSGKNVYVTLPFKDTEVDKVDMDMYLYQSTANYNGIMGSAWSGTAWLFAHDGDISWMTNPRTTLDASPSVPGYHKVILDANNGSYYDGIQRTSDPVTVNTTGNNLNLFSARGDTSYSSYIGIGRTKLYKNDVLLADLVPVNEFYNNYKLIDNTPLSTSSGWTSYPTSLAVSDAPQILTHVRIELKYQDHNNLWHSTSYIMPRANVTGNGPIVPFTDGGPISKVTLKVDNRAYILLNVTGATRTEFPIYADIRVCRDSKEGGFYDTINNKYYFSNTSTPLTYTEYSAYAYEIGETVFSGEAVDTGIQIGTEEATKKSWELEFECNNYYKNAGMNPVNLSDSVQSGAVCGFLNCWDSYRFQTSGGNYTMGASTTDPGYMKWKIAYDAATTTIKIYKNGTLACTVQYTISAYHTDTIKVAPSYSGTFKYYRFRWIYD